jgi:type VII secretion protein EccB
MASRRDELNAYTFARKRMVGAFLQPAGGGSDEDAPRPIRAVVPSLVVAMVAVAGFGLWGLLKPTAPLGWDSGKNVILGKDSTTRYVVLTSADGSKMLHPVLNMASAKLVLPADSSVVIVADSAIDNYKAHGPTIGIPYAPDKLPSAADAGVAKKWSVCDRPGSDDSHPNQGVFVTAGADAATLERPDRLLNAGQSLYVQAVQKNGVPGTQYLVDSLGRAHVVGAPGMSAGDVRALQIALFGNQAKPEQVSDEWLGTLAQGSAITFPQVPGMTAAKAHSSVQLSDPKQNYVGRLVSSQGTYYVVGTDRLYQVTAFEAELIRQAPITAYAYDQGNPTIAEITPADNARYGRDSDTSGPMAPVSDWPTSKPAVPVNGGDPSTAHPVICSTLEGMNGNGIQRSVWAGTGFPAAFVPGSASAYVSPGHGLFYRAVDSSIQGSGSDYLITETGLRYFVPAGNDGPATGATPTPAPSASPQSDTQPQVNEAQARLGYKDTVPVPVPKAWSDLIPAGPALNTKAALQEQTS